MREFWTDEDKAIAVAMKRAGIPTKDIAKRLGRTARAISDVTHKAKARRRLDGSGGGFYHFKATPVAITMYDEDSP